MNTNKTLSLTGSKRACKWKWQLCNRWLQNNGKRLCAYHNKRFLIGDYTTTATAANTAAAAATAHTATTTATTATAPTANTKKKKKEKVKKAHKAKRALRKSKKRAVKELLKSLGIPTPRSPHYQA